MNNLIKAKKEFIESMKEQVEYIKTIHFVNSESQLEDIILSEDDRLEKFAEEKGVDGIEGFEDFRDIQHDAICFLKGYFEIK